MLCRYCCLLTLVITHRGIWSLSCGWSSPRHCLHSLDAWTRMLPCSLQGCRNGTDCQVTDYVDRRDAELPFSGNCVVVSAHCSRTVAALRSCAVVPWTDLVGGWLLGIGGGGGPALHTSLQLSFSALFPPTATIAPASLNSTHVHLVTTCIPLSDHMRHPQQCVAPQTPDCDGVLE